MRDKQVGWRQPVTGKTASRLSRSPLPHHEERTGPPSSVVLEEHLVGHLGPAVQVVQHVLVQLACERNHLDPGDRVTAAQRLVQELRDRTRIVAVRERPGRLITRCELRIDEDDADARHM